MTREEILWQHYKQLRRLYPQEAVHTVSLSHLRTIIADTIHIHIDWLIRVNNRRLKMLDRPFPSCPLHPGRYELRIQRDDGSFHAHTFYSVYPARKFFDICRGDRKATWIDRKTMRCADLTFKSKHMERIFTHEYTPEEREWMLPMPYAYYARSIAFNEVHDGSPEAATARSNSIRHIATGDSDQAPEASTSRSRRRNKRISRRDDASSTETPPRASERPVQPKRASGLSYGITELAAATGKEPSKVRAILRAKVPKPVEGWLWDEAGYNQVLKIVAK
jgi:hypothetical protein